LSISGLKDSFQGLDLQALVVGKKKGPGQKNSLLENMDKQSKFDKLYNLILITDFNN